MCYSDLQVLMTSDANTNPALAALASLRRFGRPRPPDQERCELCDLDLPPEHTHLLEQASRRLVCACEACAILFDNPGAGKYHRVPRRVRLLAGFRLSDSTWQGLNLPINLAYFLHSSATGRVLACYPSPVGATEAIVSQHAWQSLVADNPVLAGLEPDVEALLVNRLGPEAACYRTGIDECYRLVGLIRLHWRGLSGGPQMWAEIDHFFAALQARSGGTPHA